MNTLELNKAVYSKDRIKQTILAYEPLVNIDMQEKSAYWVLSFTDCRYSVENTIREFENYLICLENTCSI